MLSFYRTSLTTTHVTLLRLFTTRITAGRRGRNRRGRRLYCVSRVSLRQQCVGGALCGGGGSLDYPVSAVVSPPKALRLLRRDCCFTAALLLFYYCFTAALLLLYLLLYLLLTRVVSNNCFTYCFTYCLLTALLIAYFTTALLVRRVAGARHAC
jgi:hypothetical protein